MYIAIDETGSFREGRDLEYGIVTLVTITDKEWQKLKAYIDSIFPEGWNAIKGNTIDDIRREKILKYIGTKNEIKYSSILFDLTFANDEWVENQRSGQVEKVTIAIEDLEQNGGHPNLIKEMKLLRSRLSRLSNADFSKFILIYELYREWLRFYQFDWIYIHPGNDSWDLHHIIDNQSKAGNFKTLLDQMLMLTTNHLNKDFKAYSPKELKDDHPFERKHATVFNEKSAIDGHKIFKNLKVSNEQDDPVLLLPDLIGHTIHKSIRHRYEPKWIKMLKRVKSNRSLTMNNKFREGKDNYYLVRGFDRSKTKYDINTIINDHYSLMSAA